MKKQLLTLLSSIALTAAALAHAGIEVGPNGGRILEFSKDETMHGELTVKDGKFHVAVLDKDMKPVAISAQALAASGGPSGKAAKLAVEKSGNHFVVPVIQSGEWLILQYKEDSKAKAITARVQYDTAKCGECKNEEWLCKCSAKEEKKK